MLAGQEFDVPHALLNLRRGLFQTSVGTSGEQQVKYQKEVDRYKKEKEEIMPEAKKLEQQSKEAEEKSEAAMHVHHRWAQATTLIQISIALAAITILTRSKGLEYIAYGVAAGSVAIGVLALRHI